MAEPKNEQLEELLQSLKTLENRKETHFALKLITRHFPVYMAVHHPYTMIAFNMDYMKKYHRTWLSQNMTLTMKKIDPVFMCKNDPENMFKTNPEKLFKYNFYWLVKNNLKFVINFRFNHPIKYFYYYLVRELNDYFSHMV